MHNITAKKLGEGIEVTYYEKPQPTDSDYETRKCEGQSWGDFLYKEHIASVKTVMVYADHLPEFKLITGWDNIYPTALIHGVRIQAIKDRIRLEYCHECYKFGRTMCRYCKGMHNHIVLKPQAVVPDLWPTVISMVKNYESGPHTPSLESELNDLFTITKK